MCDIRTASRLILIVVNVIFLLLGLLMLSLGISMVSSPMKIAETLLRHSEKARTYMQDIADLDTVIRNVGIFMIVVGIAVTVVSAVGLFGALRESRPLLTLYLIFVIVLLLAQLALIVFAIFLPLQLDDEARAKANATMFKEFAHDVRIHPKIYMGDPRLASYMWTVLQFEQRCCGTNGPKDYLNATRYPSNRRMIQFSNGVNRTVNYPLSCCKLNPGVNFENITGKGDFVDLEGCLAKHPNPAKNGSYNDQGCYSAVKSKLRKASRIAVWVSIVVVVVQVVIITAGFILCCAQRRNE